jgi:peptidoglycan hydrolase-like protein with peptidoglycan-binding domain
MRHRLWKLGPVMMIGLTSLSAAMGQPGRAQSPVPIAAPSSTTIELDDQDLLQLGSRGSAVVTLQQRLERLGYYTSAVDGRYGEATAAAVREFQAQHNLPVDGMVVAATWQALSDALSAQASVFPVELPAVIPPTFTRLRVAAPQPPPSHLWLMLMPMVPLAGGGLTYWVRRLRSEEPFAPPPPKQ